MTKQLFIEASGFSCRVGEISPLIEAEVSKTGMMYLKGVPATVLDEKNGNGRIYSKKEMQGSIDKLKKEGAFKNKKLLCSADDHPKDSYVSPISASHVVTDAYIKKVDGRNMLLNDWLVLDTQRGKDLKALVQGGASFGTSIRGLGQLNEETQHVEKYDMLGTDAVGNPSAGTFASQGAFEVQTESISEALASMITEQLESGIAMYDLGKAIKEFKNKYFDGDSLKPKKDISVDRKITEDLLTMQRSAVEAGIRDLSGLESLTDSIYGPTESKTAPIVQTYDKDKTNDALIKAQRELEATQNLAIHYKKITEELQASQGEARTLIKAYEDVASDIYLKLEETQSKQDGSKLVEAQLKEFRGRALKAVKQIQTEAHQLIIGLENRLENSIRVGDQFAENAVVLRRIVSTLYGQLLPENSKDVYISSKPLSTKVDEKLRGQNSMAMKEDIKLGPKTSVVKSASGWV